MISDDDEPEPELYDELLWDLPGHAKRSRLRQQRRGTFGHACKKFEGKTSGR